MTANMTRFFYLFACIIHVFASDNMLQMAELGISNDELPSAPYGTYEATSLAEGMNKVRATRFLRKYGRPVLIFSTNLKVLLTKNTRIVETFCDCRRRGGKSMIRKVHLHGIIDHSPARCLILAHGGSVLSTTIPISSRGR